VAIWSCLAVRRIHPSTCRGAIRAVTARDRPVGERGRPSRDPQRVPLSDAARSGPADRGDPFSTRSAASSVVPRNWSPLAGPPGTVALLNTPDAQFHQRGPRPRQPPLRLATGHRRPLSHHPGRLVPPRQVRRPGPLPTALRSLRRRPISPRCPKPSQPRRPSPDRRSHPPSRRATTPRSSTPTRPRYKPN